MGHQRCGSTLLAHILNSNPDICGYLETHLSYRTYSDVRWLWAFIRFKVSPLFDPRQHVALDKIVDNSTVLSSKVVHDERIRFVFIVREPSATLASQVNSFKQSVFFAEKKYLSRMRQLQAIAASVSPDRSFVVRHDDLIHRSDDVLRALTSFLKLSSPLQSSYRVENLSGKEWFGDTSSAIREGKIRVVPELPCVIPPKILERCQNVYMETCEILRAHCTSL